ncbi:MAG: cytochrome c3 family protein [Burkholderiaceae bacterium]
MNPLIARIAALAFGLAAISAHAASTASDLATRHAQRQVPCSACHSSANPQSLPAEKSLAETHQACINCHGDMKKLAELTRAKLVNQHINPHDSHLAQIDCLTCHTAHKKGESYCLQCHSFDMPMPGQAKK